MLNALAQILGVPDAALWASAIADWGERVELYRNYVVGRHPLVLTERQRNMLQLSPSSFSVDYTDEVVRAMSERLIVNSVSKVDGRQSDADWISTLLRQSDFDILQSQLHYAAIRDGDAYIMLDWDGPDRENMILTLDFAFNGSTGIIPVDFNAAGHLLRAVKVFDLGGATFAWVYDVRDDVGLQLQYSVDKAAVTHIQTVAWPGPIPIIPFSNRRDLISNMGMSEVAKVLPSQDALNRTMIDMQMTSRFSAFPAFFAKGFKYKQSPVEPGVVINPTENNNHQLVSAMDMKALPQAGMAGYIEQLDRIVEFMADISQTPLRSKWGANLSGEAMGRLESGLLSKIGSAQVYFGNSWKIVFDTADTLWHAVSGSDFTVDWDDVEVRSGESIIRQAVEVYKVMNNRRLFMRMINKVLDLDEEAIDELLEQDEQDESNQPVVQGAVNDDRDDV